MNIEEVRKYCLSLPDTEEAMPYGEDWVVFRVGGKIFLHIWLEAPIPTIAVKLLPERGEELSRWDGYEDFRARVKLDGKYGYIDTKGNYLIEPKYDSIGYFCDGFASVELNGKYGVINQEGKIVIDLKYDGVRVGKIVETTLDFKKGFIDLEQNIVVEPKFDDLWDFSEELCGASINDKWGYINKQGNYSAIGA